MSTSPSDKIVDIDDNELVLRINSGEYELFHILIKRYQPYINSTALSLSTAKSEIEDLVQEGNVALFSAVRGFSPNRASFKTFAFTCIKNAMLDVLNNFYSKEEFYEVMQNGKYQLKT